MHWLDTVILLILGTGTVLGVVRGLLWQVSGIVSVGLAVFSTVQFTAPLTPVLQASVLQEAPPMLAQVVAGAFLFLGVCLAVFLLTVFLDRAIKKIKLQWVNRTLGGIWGAGKLGLILGAILLGLGPQLDSLSRRALERSVLAPLLADSVGHLLQLTPDNWRAALKTSSFPGKF